MKTSVFLYFILTAVVIASCNAFIDIVIHNPFVRHAALGEPISMTTGNVGQNSSQKLIQVNTKMHTPNMNNTELMVLESINKSNSELLTKLHELEVDRSSEVTDIISTYLTVISFLIGVATFLLGFFLQLEYDGKLTDKMKLYYRILTIGLIIPSAYMISHGIYLIITELHNNAYLVAMILTSVPIGILIYLIRKR